MKRMIIFTKVDFEKLKKKLDQQKGQEEAAFLIAGINKTKEMLSLLVREVIPVSLYGFLEKQSTYLVIDPDFMCPIVKKCRDDDLSLIMVHSHPFSSKHVSFSGIDNEGEAILIPKIQQRLRGRPVATMVLSEQGVDARVWDGTSNAGVPIDSIRIISGKLEDITPSSSSLITNQDLSGVYNRQILAFGEEFQKKIQNLFIGIVGVGGIGSQVFQQLVHLGVNKIMIIDPDWVERANLSRLVGSRPIDAIRRKYKVDVMKRFGREINPNLEIEGIIESIIDPYVALRLKEVDIIFCCTDTIVSRAVINNIACQYLIPTIDMGVNIQCDGCNSIRSAAGRVMAVIPGKSCLNCMGILNQDIIYHENLRIADEHPVSSNYISGSNVVEPSVISLNGVVASLGVIELINMLTGFETNKENDTYQMYRVLNGIVQLYRMTPEKECTQCKDVKGMGDSLSLPCIDMIAKQQKEVKICQDEKEKVALEYPESL